MVDSVNVTEVWDSVKNNTLGGALKYILYGVYGILSVLGSFF